MESDFSPTSSQKVFSVSELSTALKNMVESQFSNVCIKAEISAVKVHTSGHAYFALKDAHAVIDAVCWRGIYGRLAIKPKEGMEAVCRGRLTTYPGRSKYQIVVENIEPAGEGALLKLLEERKRALAAEGLFAMDRKKPLPFLPQRIGIITSQTGAVIRDILHRLQDRCPRHVILWPVAVQGKGAAQQTIGAIKGFHAHPDLRPDVIIVARGGGSLEDLWEFNDESLVRIVAHSKIPIISAVGHETDTTLIDYAADRRAPTPTAAAEMAVPVLSDLMMKIDRAAQHLSYTITRVIKHRRSLVEGFGRGLISPRRIIENAFQTLDDKFDRIDTLVSHQLNQRTEALKFIDHRLKRLSFQQILSAHMEAVQNLNGQAGQAVTYIIKDYQKRLGYMANMLESLSHKNVLKRGYAMVQSTKNEPITSVENLIPDTTVTLQLKDGQARTLVKEIKRYPLPNDK